MSWYRNMHKVAQTSGDKMIFEEVSRAIADAFKYHDQEIKHSPYFMVTLFGEPVAVYNNVNIPALGLAVENAIAKHLVDASARHEGLPAASTAVCLSSSLGYPMNSGMYRTVLFHELVHVAQIYRARKRLDIDFDSMSDKDVVRGVVEGSLPRAMSTIAEPDFGSLHAEYHVMMMQTAEGAFGQWRRMIANGADQRFAENTVVASARKTLYSMMNSYRKSTQTLPEDSRWLQILRPAMKANDVSQDGLNKKPKYRISDHDFTKLMESYMIRCEAIIRSSVRSISQKLKK